MTREEAGASNRDELRYLDALADSYPEPISHTELAELAGVSKAAVTKAKEKLVPMVDLQKLAFDKFVLRSDSEGVGKVAEAYFRSGRITKFITSKFIVAMMRTMNIHDQIAKLSSNYASVFDKHDTEFMVEIIVRNLSVLREIGFVAEEMRNRPQHFLVQFSNLKDFDPLPKDLNLKISNEKSLTRILELRDKWFAFLSRELSDQIQKMSIISELPEKEKQVHIHVYVKTIDFYLRRLFGGLTDEIAKVADPKIKFKHEYYEMSRFYNTTPKVKLVASDG